MRLSTALTYLGLLMQSKSSSATVTIEDAKACNADVPAIDWLILEGDANAEAIEDEVRQDLEKIGFKVNTRFLTKNDYNQARKSYSYLCALLIIPRCSHNTRLACLFFIGLNRFER